MDYVKMSMDKRGAMRKVFELEAETLNRARKSAQKLGELGKFYARSIAPYDSGKTFQNIVLLRGNTKVSMTILARNPTKNDGHRRRIKQFNLVRWMHDSPNAQQHIHSGDRQFMYTTADYLRGIARSTTQGEFNKLIINKR